MMSVTQGIGGAIISTLGTIVAIFALAIFIVWTIKEIAVKNQWFSNGF